MSDDTPDDADPDPDVQLESQLRANEEFATGVRLGIQSALGQTGFNDDGAERNHYEVFGWPRDDRDGWDEDNWLALYLRNAYARVVIEKPAFTTWRDRPDIVDPGADDETPTDNREATAFERATEKLATNHNVWSYCERVDRAAGIGQHGLLLVGFRDVAGEEADMTQWREDAREQDFTQLSDITGFKPLLEAQIEDIDYGGIGSERWGRPVEYTIDLDDEIDSETEDDPEGTITCHWTRVIDVPATRPLDDETLARPRMEPVLNNLLDIEKTLGAAAEAAYRAADYGLHLNADPTEVDLSGNMDDLADELQRYEQGLQRYLRTSGMEVNRLGGDIQDPSGIVENNLDAIAGQTGIPKKEFRGNESGEVSGAEADERSYFGMIAERREQYATPHVIRPLLDRLQAVGILDTPSAGEYRVEWPDLTQLSESDQADIEAKRAQVISAVPGLAGDLAMQYLKDGADALPTDESDDPLAANLDEGDAAVQETFAAVVGSDTANAESVTDLDLTPPAAAQEAAQQALDWANEHGRDIAMTETGWARAEQLASGEALSAADIADGTDGMVNWWARHDEDFALADDVDEPWQDPGWVAGKGWGGEAGRDWARRMDDQITDIRGNESRYVEGDEVSTPDGPGVVVEVATENFDGPNGETVSASGDSPTYIVGVESGAATFKADALNKKAIDVDGVDDPAGELSANADGWWDRLVAHLTGNVDDGRQFDYPDSWDESETPNRIILLKAWAGLGGRFTSCRRKMAGDVTNPNRFCASMKDAVLQWEGWRKGG